MSDKQGRHESITFDPHRLETLRAHLKGSVLIPGDEGYDIARQTWDAKTFDQYPAMIIMPANSSHPDLFWELRGGGGNFGVVTALECALYPVNEIFAGQVVYPIEQGRLPTHQKPINDYVHSRRDMMQKMSSDSTTISLLLRDTWRPRMPSSVSEAKDVPQV